MEITSQHVFPSRGASIFGQELVSRAQPSVNPPAQNTFREFKVWTFTLEVMCENYSSCSLQTFLSQFEP